jgi:hypothetical protein
LDGWCKLSDLGVVGFEDGLALIYELFVVLELSFEVFDCVQLAELLPFFVDFVGECVALQLWLFDDVVFLSESFVDLILQKSDILRFHIFILLYFQIHLILIVFFELILSFGILTHESIISQFTGLCQWYYYSVVSWSELKGSG